MDGLRAFLVVAVLVGMVINSDGLNENQLGTCVIQVPSFKSITYLCGIDKARVCRRVEKLKTGLVGCCDRWEWKQDEDKCVPKCEFGCMDGTCVAPDVCECKPPRTLVDHACVEPTL